MNNKFKTYRRCNVTFCENDKMIWRRAELTDLPKLKEMTTGEWCKMNFGFSELAQIITNNHLSMCQVNCNNEISIFLSLSGRPNLKCVPSENWTEWFNHFYDLDNVQESNTLFVHVFLFQCADSLIYLKVFLETIYVEIPEVNNILFIKVPEKGFEDAHLTESTDLYSPFTVLYAKNVIYDQQFGCPKIMYHTKASCIAKICLRIAEPDDFIELRATLGKRLDFLDDFYGEFSLAKILEFPGEGRVNLVPIQHGVNGLVTITTSVDYSLLDTVFDLFYYTGLIESKDVGKTKPKGILRAAGDVKTAVDTKTTNIAAPAGVKYEMLSRQMNDSIEKTNLFFQDDNNYQLDNVSYQYSVQSTESSSIEISANKGYGYFKELCDNKLTNIIKDFLKFENVTSAKESYYNKSEEFMKPNKLDYQKTSFIIELMLIEINDEKKASWDYLVEYFKEFPQYDYCLLSIQTTDSPPEFKKFFCRAVLKPGCNYPLGLLYILHRSSLLGNFNCVLATKEHLEIMEDLIKDHSFKKDISNNISKSIFEDTTYKTYIFQCYNHPIGYCVIKLNDEIQFLSSNFDVARYIYPEYAQNHMAVILNMDFQRIFLKNVRCFLKFVMDDSNINCLFYKYYSDSTIIEQCDSCYITGMKELIPIKPRIRIQYDDDNNMTNDYEKFSLFHMNLRLSTVRKNSIDARIIVVGASVVALSFLESLIFNPVNYYTSFENIVLISDNGIPYGHQLSDLEESMVPKTAHYNFEYMKSIGLNAFVNIISGTVTAINSVDKKVTVNEDYIYYDYLFLFNGEQFTFIAEDNNLVKSNEEKNVNTLHDSYFEMSKAENEYIENIFLLNSERDIINSYDYIETMQMNDKDIIVYGKYLGSLSVINVLLESDIDGSRIIYMESDVKENLPFISSQFIQKSVYEELDEQGVRVYEQCKIKTYKFNKKQTKILEVEVESNKGQVTVNCAGLFWFEQKFINKFNWLTMIRSSFKFDGHLMVNTSFETNVEYVYAAGSTAKFTNNEFFVTASHLYYNNVEIGTRVAKILMKMLNVIEDDQINADYTQPLSIHCRLPGGYNYLRSAVPGLELMTGSTNVLKTGNAAQGYFEIITDERGDVLELSCYSKRAIKCSNYINLCGKNVDFFNDILVRMSTNSIPCLFDYFDESWSYPMYSDKFWKLVDDIMYKLKHNEKGIEKFIGDGVVALEFEYETNTLSELSRAAGLDARFDQIYSKKLQNVLLKFIDDNADDFPVFSHVREAVDRMNSNEYQ